MTAPREDTNAREAEGGDCADTAILQSPTAESVTDEVPSSDPSLVAYVEPLKVVEQEEFEQRLVQMPFLQWFVDEETERGYLEFASYPAVLLQLQLIIAFIAYTVGFFSTLSSGPPRNSTSLAFRVLTVMVMVFSLAGLVYTHFFIARPQKRCKASQHRCGFQSKAVREELLTLATRLERFSAMVYLISGTNIAFAYGIGSSCHSRRADPVADSVHFCFHNIYPHVLSIQAVPYTLGWMRTHYSLPITIFLPVLLWIGRVLPGVDRIDTQLEFLLKMWMYVGGTMSVCLILYLLERASRARFVQHMKTSREEYRARERQAMIGATLKQLLPGDTFSTITRGSPVVDVRTNCGVSIAQIDDFYFWNTCFLPVRAIYTIDTLFTLFDESLVKSELEKAKVIGDTYVATQGLRRKCTEETPDFTKLLLFALRQLRGTAALARVQPGVPSIKVAVSAGSCVGGLIGQHTLTYNLAGTAWEESKEMAQLALPGQCLVANHALAFCSGQWYQKSLSTKQKETCSVPCTVVLKKHAREKRGNAPVESQTFSQQPPASPTGPADSDETKTIISVGVTSRSEEVDIELLVRSTQPKLFAAHAGEGNARAKDKMAETTRRIRALKTAEKRLSASTFALASGDDDIESLVLATSAKQHKSSFLIQSCLLVNLTALLLSITAAEGTYTLVSLVLTAVSLTHFPLRRWILFPAEDSEQTGASVSSGPLYVDLAATSSQIVTLFAAALLSERSVVNGQVSYLAFWCVFLFLFCEPATPWKASVFASAHVIIGLFVAHTFLYTKGVSYTEIGFFNVAIFVSVTCYIWRERLFRVSTYTGELTELHRSQAALTLQRHNDVLQLLMPASMIELVPMKLEGFDRANKALPGYDLMDVATLEVELRCASGEIHVGPTQHFQSMIDQLSAVEAAVSVRLQKAGQSLTVNIIRVVGDRVLLGGPLELPKAAPRLLTSTTEMAHGNQLWKRTQSETLALEAARALFAVVGELSRTYTESSYVLAYGSGWASLLGAAQPTFDVLGPVTRVSSSILDAAPMGGFIGTTQQFLGLLGFSHVSVDELAVSAGLERSSTTLWSVRGAGIQSVTTWRSF